MDFIKSLGKNLIIFDGAMGTMLQEEGLSINESPADWCITNPDKVLSVHKKYLEAGVDVIITNTFGANPHRVGENYEKIVSKGVEIARQAVKENKCGLVALDIGPCGGLIKPMGDLEFDYVYECFKKVVEKGKGADLIIIETMTDLYELKAAILAAKENSNLPVVASFTVDLNGKLLNGADLETAATVIESLGADVIGLNCGFGPEELNKMLRLLKTFTNLPILVMPNAGLPVIINGKAKYLMTDIEFADNIKSIVNDGAYLVGGCCGSNPLHMKKVVETCKDLPLEKRDKKVFSRVSSYAKTVNFDKTIIIGERINPTGRKLMKEALRNLDYNFLLDEAIAQQEEGAHILDVNVGLADIDEEKVLQEAISNIQAVTALPLQIDTSNAAALEKALRIYNGKPLINSVNGKQSSMDLVLPLVSKYGAMVVCLTLDEKGIPASVEGRIDIAKKIIKEAEKYSISKENLIFDALAMTISAGKDNANIALETVSRLTEELKVKTILGVSNISFGLPNRDIINSVFFAKALERGLSAGIINPKSNLMQQSYYAHEALSGNDENCQNYIAYYGAKEIQIDEKTTDVQDKKNEDKSKDLIYAIMHASKTLAISETKNLLKILTPLEVVEKYVMPALDEVGKKFEDGSFYLPQLIASAETAKESFNLIKEEMQKSGASSKKGDRILLATVQGDIHDIGKNIVKLVLENYGFDVLDLGKDVTPEKIVDTVIKENIKLVGLSALMTTTVINMESTIKLLKEKTDATVMVGGAVLTKSYAEKINADFYGKDAVASANFAKEFSQKMKNK